MSEAVTSLQDHFKTDFLKREFVAIRRKIDPAQPLPASPIGCFGDQSHTGLSAQEYCYTLPYENMVVDCENPDLS